MSPTGAQSPVFGLPTRTTPASRYSTYVRTMSGLAAFWRMTDSPGPSITDYGPNGRTGTISGTVTTGQPTLTIDKAAKSCLFGGGFVQAADDAALDLADTFSIVAIIKPGASGSNRAIVSKGSGAYYLRLTTTNQPQLLRSSVANICTAATGLTAGVVYHVAATKAGGTVKLYVNGADVTGAVTNSTCVDNSSALQIGRDPGSGGETANGTYQEVALFNRALSASEVAYLASLVP